MKALGNFWEGRKMMKSLPVPQPSFLAQPCPLPPLLVSEVDAARLLAIGRADIKLLVAEGDLQLVNVNGMRRITVGSIVGLVDQLAVKGAAAAAPAAKPAT
jgi:hypothetical protein